MAGAFDSGAFWSGAFEVGTAAIAAALAAPIALTLATVGTVSVNGCNSVSVALASIMAASAEARGENSGGAIPTVRSAAFARLSAGAAPAGSLTCAAGIAGLAGATASAAVRVDTSAGSGARIAGTISAGASIWLATSGIVSPFADGIAVAAQYLIQAAHIDRVVSATWIDRIIGTVPIRRIVNVAGITRTTFTPAIERIMSA